MPRASPAFCPFAVPRADGRRSIVTIGEDGSALRFALFSDDGDVEGSGQFTRESLAELTSIAGGDSEFDLELIDGRRTMTLHDGYQPRPFEQFVSGTVPIVDERLQMRITLGAIPTQLVELPTNLLPVVLWIFAAIIGSHGGELWWERGGR